VIVTLVLNLVVDPPQVDESELSADPFATMFAFREVALPDANVSVRACAWPGCQKGKSEPAAAPRDLQHSPKSLVIAARCKTTTTSGWQEGEYTSASSMRDCKNILFFA